MALDGTYTGLQASVADWLARADLTSQIVDFIALGEQMMNTELRLRCMQASAQITASSIPGNLPTDWLEYRSLRHTIAPFNAITIVAEGWANDHDYYISYFNDPPTHYTIEGLTLRLATKNAGSWTFDTTYYQKLAISTSNAASVAVFTKYPSLYLFSALMASIPFIGLDARAQTWIDGYQSQKALAITDDNRAKFSGSVPVQRVRRAP